jgi:hypothetical protein
LRANVSFCSTTPPPRGALSPPPPRRWPALIPRRSGHWHSPVQSSRARRPAVTLGE